MMRNLLAPYEQRPWAQTNWILVRLWRVRYISRYPSFPIPPSSTCFLSPLPRPSFSSLLPFFSLISSIFYSHTAPFLIPSSHSFFSCLLSRLLPHPSSSSLLPFVSHNCFISSSSSLLPIFSLTPSSFFLPHPFSLSFLIDHLSFIPLLHRSFSSFFLIPFPHPSLLFSHNSFLLSNPSSAFLFFIPSPFLFSYLFPHPFLPPYNSILLSHPLLPHPFSLSFLTSFLILSYLLNSLLISLPCISFLLIITSSFLSLPVPLSLSFHSSIHPAIHIHLYNSILPHLSHYCLPHPFLLISVYTFSPLIRPHVSVLSSFLIPLSFFSPLCSFSLIPNPLCHYV